MEHAEDSKEDGLLSIMTATFLRVAVRRSARPRTSSGAMRARVGESTSETKVVAARSWMVLGTSFSGSIKQVTGVESAKSWNISRAITHSKQE